MIHPSHAGLSSGLLFLWISLANFNLLRLQKVGIQTKIATGLLEPFLCDT